MDSAAFDRIARLLGAQASRRAGLGAAIGAALGLAAAPTDGLAGNDNRRRHRADGDGQGRDRRVSAEGPCKQNRCKRNQDCCTKFCLIPKGQKRGKCRCIAVGEPCNKNQTCCGTLACTKGVCTSTRPVKVETGSPCSPRDVCRNEAASCVPYQTGAPDGTYCLYPDGTGCGTGSVCASGTCRNAVCAPPPIATGEACAASDVCADADASCTAYLLGTPAGTYCLLPAAAACGDDDLCESSFCTGGACAATCTVCSSGCPQTSIATAFAAASAGDVIGVGPGSYSEAIASVDKDITIRRCGSTGVVDWSNATSNPTLPVAAGVTLTIANLDLHPDDPNSSSPSLVTVVGAAGNVAKLLASGVTFRDRTADTYGALALLSYAEADLLNCTISNNTGSDTYGGAIWVGSNSSLAGEGCTFTDNDPGTPDSYAGGAIAGNSFDSINLTGCTFTGNGTDSYDGGAICAIGGNSVTLTDCTFTNNKGTEGGALFFESTAFTITGCTFTGNTAKAAGGALMAEVYAASSGTISTTTMSGNSATGSNSDNWWAGGGAIFVRGYAGSVTITDSTLSGNSHGSKGGAIFGLEGNGTTTITLAGSTSITGNSVVDSVNGAGSAIAVNGSFTVNGASTRVSSNTTPPPQCSSAAAGPSSTYSEVVNCAF